MFLRNYDFRRLFVAVASCACTWFGQVASSSASPTDRTVLYGISPFGTVVQLNTTTGAATVVRQLRYPDAFATNGYYRSLAVYKGTFIATTLLHTTVAFGLNENDELPLPLIRPVDFLDDISESPASGPPLGWTPHTLPGGSVAYQILQLYPAQGVEANISAPSDITLTDTFSPYWACGQNGSGAVTASAFFGGSKSYFIRICHSTNGYSQNAPEFVRAELQNGSWVKTMDLLANVAIPGALVADPANDGTLYSGLDTPTYTSTHISRIVISGSTVTETALQTLNGIPAIEGLAFGPPAADVVNPRNVSEFAPYLDELGWKPVEMMFKSSNY